MRKIVIAPVIVALLALNVFAEKAWAEESALSVDQDLALGVGVDRQRTFKPTEGSTNSDLFGTAGGYIHPFVSLFETYSDNIYNTLDATKNDLITTISPGIALSYPGRKDIPGSTFATSNVSPGGLLATRKRVDYFQRTQSSLVYQADVEKYSENTQADQTHHRLEGLVQFNLKSGITLDFAGEYKKSTDSPSNAPSRSEFASRMVDFAAYADLGRKFTFALDASTFYVDYDLAINRLLDHKDRAYSASLHYKIGEYTSTSATYRISKVDYDLSDLTDKDIRDIGLGLNWDITAKSSGSLEAGYEVISEPNKGNNDSSDMTFRFLMAHKFSPRSSLNLSAARRINESTVVGSSTVLNHQGSAGYTQGFGPKFFVHLNLSYSEDSYDKPIVTTNGSVSRKDYTLLLSPSLDYKTKDWFVFSAIYSYANLNSNIDSYDFKTNTYILRLTAYL